MTTRTNPWLIGILLLLGAAGCVGPQRTRPGAIAGDQTLSLEDLALRLGLRIEERDDTFVVMKDAANTVIVFTHPDGRFFVNGKPLGSVGQIRREGGTVYVPEILLSQIRTHLRLPGQEPPTRPPRRARGMVVIDAGHGGHDPGAISVTGIHEKNVDLRVAAKVARLLEQRGVGVKMTRWQDHFIELEERAEVANRLGADLFVSIHADAAESPEAQGFTIYVAREASSEARRAARSISQAMARTGTVSRGVREADYRVLVNTAGPAVLVELGYLSNRREAVRLSQDAHQNRLAQAIVDGILSYLR